MLNPKNLIARYKVVAWRRRWHAMVLAWIVCLVGWLVVASIPNQYHSSARLYVDTGAVLTPLLKGLALDSSTSSDVDILQRTLLSRPNLEKLISKTDLDLRATTRAEREELIESLGTAIRIQPQTRNLFTIDYYDRNPRLTRDVVQTIVTLFIENATGNSRDDMAGAREFLERQISTYEGKLRAAEQARAAFQVKYAELLPSATGGASGLDAAHALVQSLKGQVVDATARRDLLQQEMSTTKPVLGTEAGSSLAAPRPVTAPVATPLAEAEQTLRTLRMRFTENYPEVVAARKNVEALKARTTEADGGTSAGKNAGAFYAPGRLVPNPVYEQLKVRLIDAESALASLQRQAADATQEETRLAAIARGAPGAQAAYINLNRDYDVLRKNYDELLARRESMQIGSDADEQADKVKLRIVDAPQIPTVPTGPKRLLFMVGVLVMGTGCGLGLIFMAWQLDHSFYSVQDLRELGLPILGGISLRDRRQARRRYSGLIGIASSICLLVVAFGGFATYPLWLHRLV